MKTAWIESYQPCEKKHRVDFPVELHSQKSSRRENDTTLLRDLQEAARRKDEFLAMLGHELRNPIAPIRNAMQIFRLKVGADPALLELIEMVERQIQQLARLIEDLLDASRAGHGKVNLEMKPIDLKSVVALAIETSRPLIDARKHVLKVALPPHAVEVEGDSRRLVQVVTNLRIDTARKKPASTPTSRSRRTWTA
jgi:signal transduction histidine kinase